MNHFKLLTQILIIVGLIPIQTSQATSHSTITLKNGSVVKGDIVGQRFGSDITVEAEYASFIIEPKDIISKGTRKVKYENLSREMKRWVLENKALIGDAYGRYAELEDISTKKNKYTGLVKIDQDGKEAYIQVSPNTLIIKWSDIQSIVKSLSKDIKYNITDKVSTFAGKTYEGRIVSQKTGENLSIETTKGRVTIPNKDITEIRKIPQNASNSPFNEIDFVNIIVLKDGKEKEGLITAQHYGKKEKDNYLVMLDKSGKSEIILISNISEQRTKYDKIATSPYTPGKVYLNEFKIEPAEKTQKGLDNVVFLDKKVYPFPEGISMTFKSDGNNLANGWSLVALSELPTFEGKSSWGYSIKNKKENKISPSSKEQTSSINYISFGYLSPGFYALVNETDTEAYIFKITK